jgi:diguanylate cyclase (GGDEF)-like protein
LASADYLVHAERIIDGETIGLLSADGFDYEQVTANKTILTDEWNESFYLDNGDVYYMIVSPISVEVKVLGYDHVIFRYNEPLAMFKSEYVSSEIIDATAYAELTNYAEIVAFNDNSEIMIIDHVYYHVTDLTDTYYFVTSQDEESLLHAVENLMYRAVIVIPSLLLAQILVIFFVVIFYVGREFAVYENHNRKLSRELDKAQLDSLTGVGARALCEEELGFLFAEYIKNGISPAILMFDLDDLKKINDSYGHLAGDEAIKAAVDAVVASIRADDHVYRWGGDEFVGIIYGLLPQNVSNFVEKIQQAFANLEVIFENNVIRPRISIGVTYFYEQDSDYFNAISRADYAMYKSKINGTNQSTVV